MRGARWLVFLVGVAACRSAPGYRAPHYADPAANFRALVADGKRGIAPEDEALWRCELASAAMMVGEEAVAFRALHKASAIMGTLESTSAEDARAILGEEATKTWKGDPYERSMNSLYKGLLYWRRGDLDNASACFKRGLLADGWSQEGESQRDFEVLAFLLGWVSSLRGESEQASYSFREAAQLRGDNPWFHDPGTDRNNVLVVADIGIGPRRVAAGRDGSEVRFISPDYPDAAIEILEGGRSLGVSRLATDLYFQAITRGDKVIDRIRRGKAIFKQGAEAAGYYMLLRGANRDDAGTAIAGAALLLLGALTNAEADTRFWTQLPAEIHVLPLSLPPGPHRITVRVLGPGGSRLGNWQRDFPVDVPADGDTLYYFRTSPGGGIHGLTDRKPRSQPAFTAQTASAPVLRDGPPQEGS